MLNAIRQANQDLADAVSKVRELSAPKTDPLFSLQLLKDAAATILDLRQQNEQLKAMLVQMRAELKKEQE